MKRISICIGVVALLAAAQPLAAQRDSSATDDSRTVQPERPTVATHAHTVARGILEIETGVQGDRVDGPRFWSSPTELKVGLASHLQLNIYTPFYLANAAGVPNGLGDIALGLKWRILDDDPILGDFAILPILKLATASENSGLGSGSDNLGLTLISSHDFNGTSMDLNVGYTQAGIGRQGSVGSALLTASFGIPVWGQLNWCAELFSIIPVNQTGVPTNVSVLTGPQYQVVPELAVDAGVIVPIQGGPHSLYAGLVWNVGRFLPSADSPALAGDASRRTGVIRR